MKHHIMCSGETTALVGSSNADEDSCVKKNYSLSVEETCARGRRRRHRMRWWRMIFECWTSQRQWLVTDPFGNMPNILTRPIKQRYIVVVADADVMLSALLQVVCKKHLLNIEPWRSRVVEFRSNVGPHKVNDQDLWHYIVLKKKTHDANHRRPMMPITVMPYKLHPC